MEIDVSIIIVNYKTDKLVKECLSSLFIYTRGITFEVTVVDNDSDDNIEEVLLTEFPTVEFIKSRTNVGFGAANNLAMKKATGKYIFLLNPDTVLLNNAIKIFYDYCEVRESQRDIGCIGGFLEDVDGGNIHSYGKFLNFSYDLFYTIGYSIKKLFYLKNTKFITPLYVKYTKSIDVDYITGADLFIPRDTLKDVGNFDESFFMYSEETDLQYRMMKKKYRRVVIPGPRIIHLEGQSFSLSNSRRVMMAISKFIYVKKNKTRLHYIVMKTTYLISGAIGAISDLYYKEYSSGENIKYLKCLVKNEYF